MTQTTFPGTPVISPTTGEPLPSDIFSSKVAHPFGHAVSQTGQPEWDFKKELTNKLAWVLGTSYGVPYSKKRDLAQHYAARIVSAVVRDHGYSNSI